MIAIEGTSFCRLLHLRPASTSGLAHKRSLAVPFLLDCHSTFCNVRALCECYRRYFILLAPAPSASTSGLAHKASLALHFVLDCIDLFVASITQLSAMQGGFVSAIGDTSFWRLPHLRTSALPSYLPLVLIGTHRCPCTGFNHALHRLTVASIRQLPAV